MALAIKPTRALEKALEEMEPPIDVHESILRLVLEFTSYGASYGAHSGQKRQQRISFPIRVCV